jgi:hypothetical protein
MEMEIQKDYHEVLSMLEGVLLHIFRGIESMSFEPLHTSVLRRL